MCHYGSIEWLVASLLITVQYSTVQYTTVQYSIVPSYCTKDSRDQPARPSVLYIIASSSANVEPDAFVERLPLVPPLCPSGYSRLPPPPPATRSAERSRARQAVSAVRPLRGAGSLSLRLSRGRTARSVDDNGADARTTSRPA